jgi:SAM-dependent methyltransferase
MIEVSCYNCGSKDSTLYATENGCSLVKCVGCGLLYVNPRPSDQDIEDGVKIGVHRGETTLTSTGHYMPLKVDIYNRVLSDIYGIELQSRKRTWLDVGCGHGELLVALRELFKNNVVCKGIEPNQHKITAAQKRGLDVDYFDLASHDQCYDTISLLNVYSHLPSPPEFFRLVRRRLKPNGEILLETGDTANLLPDQHPRPFLLPDHLSFGSEQVITNLLRRAGFEIISVNKYPAVKFRFMKADILKDIVKALLPHKKTRLSDLYKLFRAAVKYRTDMWIRARVAA